MLMLPGLNSQVTIFLLLTLPIFLRLGQHHDSKSEMGLLNCERNCLIQVAYLCKHCIKSCFNMNRPLRTDSNKLRRQLKNYRSIVEMNKDSLGKEPFWGHPLGLWMESARFCITALEIWEESGDKTKSDHAHEKAQESCRCCNI